MFMQLGAIVFAVSSIYLGREASIKESYTAAWRKARRLILTGVLFSLALAGLMFACGIAGVIMYVIASSISRTFVIVTMIPTALVLLCVLFYVIIKLGLCTEIIMIEGLAYSKCLQKSWTLLSGHASSEWPGGYFTRFAICFAIVILVHVGITVLFWGPGILVTAMGLERSGIVIGELFNIIGDTLSGTFGSVCGVVFYYDIRSRKEGFDLQQLASRVSR